MTDISPVENVAASDQNVPEKNWTTGLGVFGAILASSCCVLPLAFVMLGISGSWIGTLTVLEPYKPYIGTMTLVFLGFGFWQVYMKPKKTCDDGSYCAKPKSDRVMKILLWSSTVLVIAALTIDYWAPVIAEYI